MNSHITLAAADALAAERLFTEAWHAATPERRAAALCTATAILDRLKWRCKDAAPLATACAELAFHLLTQAAHPGAPVQMRQLGDSLTMYFPSVADELPKHVRRLIEPFLIVGSTHSSELVF